MVANLSLLGRSIVKKQYFCPEECLWISGRNWRIEGWGWKISGLGFGGRTPVETRANGYKQPNKGLHSPQHHLVNRKQVYLVFLHFIFSDSLVEIFPHFVLRIKQCKLRYSSCRIHERWLFLFERL